MLRCCLCTAWNFSKLQGSACPSPQQSPKQSRTSKAGGQDTPCLCASRQAEVPTSYSHMHMHLQLPQARDIAGSCLHSCFDFSRHALQRQPLRKFRITARAATSEAQPQGRKRSQAQSLQVEQLLQLGREVFDTAIQTGPKGFARSIQAAGAFASVGR